MGQSLSIDADNHRPRFDGDAGDDSHQTGSPLGIGCNPPGGTDLTGGTGAGIDSRCVQVGDPKSNLQPGYWFNPDAFKVPFASGAGITSCGAFCVNGVGSISKAPIYNPGLSNYDIAFFKNFQLGGSEGRRVQFRAEGFNIFNHTQYTGVQNSGSFSAANVLSVNTAPVNAINFGMLSAAAPSPTG